MQAKEVNIITLADPVFNIDIYFLVDKGSVHEQHAHFAEMGY